MTGDEDRSAELAPGSSFGRYVVQGLLGKGGMGHVYRAQDTRLNRPVALKLLLAPKTDAVAWREATARMIREARAAAAFEHPNAVHIYDVGEIDGTPYIAMEYVKGRSLREYVGDADVPWETRVRWLVDVASALGAAHEAGLVHRDVKPRNVMVRDDGRVKVLDFGIARRVGGAVAGSEDPTLTTEGLVVGTMHYMPPEQLAGGPLDGRADQFAWGVMAYELLAGQRPWDKQVDVLATVTAILSAPPPPLEERCPFLPVVVCDAVQRTLAKLAPDRFPSMADVVAALEPYAAMPVGRSSSGQPVAFGSSASHRAASVASGSFAARTAQTGPSDAPPASSLPTVETRSARGPAVDGLRGAAPPRGRRPGLWLAAGVVAAVAVAAAAVALSRGHAGAAASTAPAASAAVSLLDLPPPASTSALALAAYRAAVQADHDANLVAARASYLEAIGDDPGLGAAQLRYAIDDFTWDVVDARAHFLKAQQLRGSLDDHGRLLFDAVEPLFVQSPPSWAEAADRLTAALAAHPRDAELWTLLGWARQVEGKLDLANEALDRASALDPSYAEPLETKITTKQLEGDVAGVVSAGDRCLQATPLAVSCIKARLWTYAQEGMCDEYERDARRTLAIDPGNAEAYEDLGQVALARGRPVEGAWEALRMGWKRATPEYAPWVEADDRGRTAVILGDVPSLQAALGAMGKLNEGRTDEWSHFEEAELLVNELTELGDLERAAQVAENHLQRKTAWTPEPGLNAFTVASDDQPLMLRALERAGRISRAELDARRTTWIAGWRKRLTPEVARYLWLMAYAEIADTSKDAAEALARQPEFGPIPRHRPWRFFGAHVGRTFLLAGRADEALPYLRKAVASCEPLEEPFTWVQSSLWLGQALEQTGAREEACGAYAAVVRRWTGLGPRSVTVAEARRRLAALKCPR